ncbi:MAG: hypothetical protein HC942_10805 [Microcoleus sp. SU_5_6]|nr:hypothetical protein [Microcoleus sp. SU_5_6]NJL66425.1 hypothetical protein [Microcoleus sp. SM1_3_4]
MKDTQNDIFTAFIVALFQQTESLPLEVQSEFNKIDETSPVTDILRLTKLHSPLLVAYKNNRIWLTKHSKQRNQKIGYSDTAKQNATNTEIDKAASDIGALTNLLNCIDRIDPEVKQRGLRSVLENMLQSRDSVQASRDTIIKFYNLKSKV